MLHFLSERPRSLYAHRLVKARDVLALLGGSAQLRAAASKKYRSISTVYCDELRFHTTGLDVSLKEHDLLVVDQILLVPLIAALGSTLRKLKVDMSCRVPSSSWANVLVRMACPVEELELTSIQAGFPLEDVPKACRALKNLKLKLRSGSMCIVTKHLERVAKRASQLTVLSLDPFDKCGGFPHAGRSFRLLRNSVLKFTATTTPPLTYTKR